MSAIPLKGTIYQFIFLLCIAVPYLNNYELTFAVWLLSAMFTIRERYSVSIIKMTGCFLAILCLAGIVSFFNSYRAYYIIRDITYMLKPVIGLLLGYQLCRLNYRKAFPLIVYTGLFIAVVHLVILFFAVVVHRAFTVNELRLYGGYFSDYEVYAVIVLIFHKKFELGFSRNKVWLFALVVGFSAFMYLARTNFIQFVILFIGMKGYYKINRTSVTVILSFIMLVVLGYSAILYINPKRNGAGIEALLYKIKIAPEEAFKTKINRGDWKDFNDNYRSYENIMTVRQVTSNGILPILFGEGLGSKIDLKQKVWLGDMELRYISILHNGYMTVFLKSGLAGIAFLIYSISLFFRQRKSQLPIVGNINLLLVASGIFMVMSYWVFMGFYFIADTKSILLGFIICYAELAVKKQHQLSDSND